MTGQTAAEPTPRCPAGGPGCTSSAFERHVNQGPLGRWVAYDECPECGWISPPFTLPDPTDPLALYDKDFT